MTRAAIRAEDLRAIGAFRRYLIAERGFSSHTVRAYVGEVERLAESEVCSRSEGLDHIDPLALRTYLASFHVVHTPATRNLRLAALRAFFRFRMRQGRLARDPTEGIPGPKPDRRLPAPLPAEDCERLIESPSERERPRLDRRDRALLDLLSGASFGCGGRGARSASCPCRARPFSRSRTTSSRASARVCWPSRCS
jgi:integrase/recombinase XerC